MLLIKNGRIVDPGTTAERTADLFVKDGRIAPLAELPAGLRGVGIP
jgi:dihydroorotase-like cyclic amidohydrolase